MSANLFLKKYLPEIQGLWKVSPKASFELSTFAVENQFFPVAELIFFESWFCCAIWFGEQSHFSFITIPRYQDIVVTPFYGE
jgi:hypothetical protein